MKLNRICECRQLVAFSELNSKDRCVFSQRSVFIWRRPRKRLRLKSYVIKEYIITFTGKTTKEDQLKGANREG